MRASIVSVLGNLRYEWGLYIICIRFVYNPQINFFMRASIVSVFGQSLFKELCFCVRASIIYFSDIPWPFYHFLCNCAYVHPLFDLRCPHHSKMPSPFYHLFLWHHLCMCSLFDLSEMPKWNKNNRRGHPCPMDTFSRNVCARIAVLRRYPQVKFWTDIRKISFL